MRPARRARCLFRTRLPVLLGSAILGASAGESLGASAEDSRFFAEQVYPILREHCFDCHGGEERLRGGFRVTSREGLLRGGDFGSGYDSADPAASLLLEMISYASDEKQMPPKAKLPEAQIAVLTRWITERGAAYDPALEIAGPPGEGRAGFAVSEDDREWWAYRPLSTAAPPPSSDPAWAENGIDAFLLRGLDEAGLKPNPPAHPVALSRRATYGLTGLPPTLEETRRFEAAWAADPKAAWTALVEDLLSRPQHGEKWARHWLDLTRYAESNGFERDNPKPHMWRYRDYVIGAFNRDLPYDRFIIEQLAGDEIAEPTLDSLAATGYHRLMQWDDEPADRKQHVYDVLADNVQVTSETFLGMTLGCARCHDHKIDPLSQRDFYSFMAFFHGVTHYQTPGTLVHWATPEERERFETDRADRLAGLSGRATAIEAEVKAHLEKSGAPDAAAPPAPYIADARSSGHEWEYTTTRPTPDWHEVGFRDKSWVTARSGFGAPGTPGAVIGTDWLTPEIWLRASFGLQALPSFLVMDLHHDEDVEIYLNGVLVHQAKGYQRDYQTVVLPPEATAALQTGRNIVAVHCRQTGGGQYIDLSLRAGNPADRDPRAILSGKGDAAAAKELEAALGRDVVREWQDLSKQIDDLGKQEAGVPVNAVAESGPAPAPLHVHLRGSAHAPGDLVQPGYPAVLGASGHDPGPADCSPVERGGFLSSGRRLALARWIASPDNPLTARVMMNRLWQHHFGRGIAPSPSDFGKLGEAPTHPELLDWLAGEFIRQGWSLKAMHRLILSSRAYRMSSAPDQAGLAEDPENLLFWRFNMRRLAAEEIRDSVLAVSGNLAPSAGGPWVFPPLPAEVLATASRPDRAWPVSPREEDHYRRSIYIHVKRSLRHPMLADFDQADTDSPCAARFNTTVPAQALSMLNSGFVNSQAAVLAARLSQAAPGAREEQVRLGLSLALQRSPRQDEMEHCLDFIARIQVQASLDDHAALERFALLALNLNEFLYLD